MATSEPLDGESAIVVVCDTGPVLHLDELASLDLLSDFRNVLIADAVWDEIGRNRPAAYHALPSNVRRIQTLLQPSAILKRLALAIALDAGEQAALAIMADYPTAIFLTDDAAARLAAQTLGYRVHGTIGILLRAIRRNQRSVTEVVEILHSIPTRSSLYIRRSLLQAIIAEVKERHA